MAFKLPELPYSYDALSRLAGSFDQKDFVNIANYTYTNNRLIKRTFGNGTVGTPEVIATGLAASPGAAVW